MLLTELLDEISDLRNKKFKNKFQLFVNEFYELLEKYDIDTQEELVNMFLNSTYARNIKNNKDRV